MIGGLLSRLRSLWQGARRRDAVEAGMREEMQHHVELRARDLEHSGVPAADALRQARLEFGSTENYRGEAREARGLAALDRISFSWLDVKLGFRMLARYPGLTLVGGAAIAFAICAGAVVYELISQMVSPRMPFAEGDRVVALRLWDAEASDPEMRLVREFYDWRRDVRTVTDIGATRTVERNVGLGTGTREPMKFAEMSASGFRMSRVPPLLGRTLDEGDERPGAPGVVVIGYNLWQRRFDGDSGIIGSRITMGLQSAEIVGVMPEGFAFPILHEMWVPLRLDEHAYARRSGPELIVFGRLAPGRSLAEAQAELTQLSQRTAQDHPDTHRHLRAEVKHYPRMIIDIPAIQAAAMMSSNLIVVMLLLLICANVALLMFARAAARESEIAVRTALGASRGRIVSQLFAEALVLGSIAAFVGLSLARFALAWTYQGLGMQTMGVAGMPFWFHADLSPVTILYAIVLTMLGAMVAGVLPGLKITRALSSTLKASSAGAGGIRFGGVWTFVIVAQVAVTVAFPAVAFLVKREALKMSTYTANIRLGEYLSASLELERNEPPADTSAATFKARYAAALNELERRLRADPSVAHVGFATVLPRMTHHASQVEVDTTLVPEDQIPLIATTSVEPGWFDVVGHPITQGRDFHAGDLQPDARSVIVTRPFVDQVLGGANPLGRLVRYLEHADNPGEVVESPWYQIVGVADDIGTITWWGDRAGIIHPIERGAAHPVYVAIHLRGDPLSFTPALRTAAAGADPSLQLNDILPLTQVISGEYKFKGRTIKVVMMLSAITLMLSLAGIYAVMSFTVARRTREIGVRIALGADARRVVMAVFKRPLQQVGMGIVTGCVLAGVIAWSASGMTLTARGALLVLVYGLLMMGVCTLACVVPTRRALAVEPTEALRSEG